MQNEKNLTDENKLDFDLNVNNAEDTVANEEEKKLVPLEKFDENLNKGNIISQNKIRKLLENSKLLNIALLTGIIISIIISALGFVLLKNSANYIAFIFMFQGIISALIFVFGIYALRTFSSNYISESDSVNINIQTNSNIDPKGKSYIDITILSLLVLFVIFLLLLARCLIFRDELIYEIKSHNIISSNPVSLDQVESLLTILGSFIFLLLFLIGFNLFFFFKFLGAFNSWKLLIQFICLVLLKFSLALLYFSDYTNKYKEVTKPDLPFWVPDGLTGISIISILISLFGFFSISTERINFLKTFTVIIALFTFICVVFSIGNILLTGRFSNKFDNKCVTVLDYINKDHLINHVGCSKKYSFTSPSLISMQCDKERIVTDWETNLNMTLSNQKESYGCVDMECCYKLFAFIKGKVDHLALTVAFVCIFGCVLVGGTWYITIQLESSQENNKENISSKVLLFFGVKIVAVFIGATVLLILIPEAPIANPVNIARNDLAAYRKIDEGVIIPNSKNNKDYFRKLNTLISIKDLIGINNLNFTEDKTNCKENLQNCQNLKFYFELSSDDGVFDVNSNLADIADIHNYNLTKNESLFSFFGDFKNLQIITDYFTFISNCPLIPNKMHIKINAMPYSDNFNKIKFLNALHNGLTSNLSSIVDFTKLKEGEIYNVLDKDIIYTYVNKNIIQSITGVVNTFNNNLYSPLPDANVKLTCLAFPQCDSLSMISKSIKTKANGEFIIENLNGLINLSPVQYRIEISHQGLLSHQEVINVGGLGKFKIIDIGKLTLWNDQITFSPKNIISAKIVNSLTGSNESNVLVSLYQGIILLNNKIIKNENKNTTFNDIQFLQLNKKTFSKKLKLHTKINFKKVLISETNSDEKGQFTFENLLPNSYTLIFEKNNFYREFMHIDVKRNLTDDMQIQMTPIVNQGEIRFVLTWHNFADLNLHSEFKISDTSKCEVFFGKKSCVDTKLIVNKGANTIDIERLGKYIYTFSVSMNKNEENNLSQAKISVYIQDYKDFVYEIALPTIADNNSWWLAFCLNGKEGLSSLTTVNKLLNTKPHFNYCESIYDSSASHQSYK